VDADISSEAESRVDPVRVFADRLRRLQVDSGGPSVRDLVRLTDKVGVPYTRGTIQDKLAGRSAAPWEFVEAFVRACALHTGSTAPPDLRPWRRWYAEMAREVAALRAGRRQIVRSDVCPFRGLEAFAAEHAKWFHGRAAAVEHVVAGLDAHRTGLVVLGPSGAGKSSVLQAGVLPALAEGALPGSDRWITVLARPGKDLLAELERAGLPGAGRQPLGTVVADRLAGEPTGARLLLAIDQFEELLTPVSVNDQEATQADAIDALTAAIGAPGLSVLLVMRDDFYPRLASQAPTLLQALTPGLLNVPATLSTQDLREIITSPAEAVGLGIQDGLPERIITDVLAADAAAGTARRAPITVLPLLELTLQQLWRRRDKHLLTHDAYHRVGGIAGALTTWCDSAIEQLPADQRTIAQRILTALVRPADDDHHIPAVRQQVPLAALRRLADTTRPTDGDRPSPEVDEVLAVLTDHRIVTTRTIRTAGPHTDAPGVPVAELVHEALIRDWAALRNWVSQDHRFQDWLRRAEERHTRWVARRDPGDLLHGGDLADGVDWSAQRRLPEHVAELLAASRHYQRTGVRRTRIVAAVLAGLLVVALAATGLAFGQRQTAVAAQREALSRQLAAQSAALMRSNSDLASLLAVQAYRTSPTAEATASLYTAADSPLRRRLETDTQWFLAFSEDRHTLATSGDDGSIRLWDMPVGRLRTILTGNTGPVNNLEFSPDKHTLAAAGDDHTVRLWDMTGARPPTILTGHTEPVQSVHFSPDGSVLASASDDDTVRMWDVASRRLRATIPGYVPGLFYSVAFSSDGQTVATGGEHGTIRLSDVSHGRKRVTLNGHTGDVTAVAFSRRGLLASASNDGTVRLWRVPGGQPVATLAGHTDGVRAVAFNADGSILATGSNDHTARLWDMDDRQPRTTLTGHSDDVHEILFSPDGRAVITIGNDAVPRLWNVADGRLRASFSGGGTNTAAFSPDGQTIATVGTSGVRLWDATAGSPHVELEDDSNQTWVVAYSPDGRTLATGGGDFSGIGAPKLRLWDAVSGKPTGTLSTDRRTTTSLAFSPDGRILASAQDNSKLQLWDPAQRHILGSFSDAGDTVAFAPDGRALATGYPDGKVVLWDVASQRRLTTLRGHSVGVIKLAFSSDGRTLASANADRTVRLWDIATRKERAVLRGHTAGVEAVAISPDGRTVASGSFEGVRLWDAATGHLRATLTGHAQRVMTVAFSPDGRTLATSSADNTVRLWDLASGHTRTIIGGYIDAVTTVAFSPDGRRLATAGWIGTVKVWDVALPTITAAIDKICRTVNRDLAPQERSVYLPSGSPTPVCP
jgi:WD40 repeat protein